MNKLENQIKPIELKEGIFPYTDKEADLLGILDGDKKVVNKNMHFPSEIKKLRKSHGMTQQDVADHLGVTKSTIGLYETGDNIPDIKNLYKLSQLFKVSADYLLGIADTKASDVSVNIINEKTGLSEDAIEILLYFGNLRIERDQYFSRLGSRNNIPDGGKNRNKLSVSNLISTFLSNHNFKTVLMCLTDLIVSQGSLKDGKMNANQPGTPVHGPSERADKTFTIKYLIFMHYANIWIEDVAKNFIGNTKHNTDKILKVRDANEYWLNEKSFHDADLMWNASKMNTDMPAPNDQDSED